MSLDRTRSIMQAASPVIPELHLLPSENGGHIFLADGSQIFEVEQSLFAQFEAASLTRDSATSNALMRQLGLDGAPFVDDTPVQEPPLQAISLAIAQKCNLGCTYCYAQQGEFGAAPKNMPLANAKRAIDLLVAEAEPGSRINIAFLGGEPLVNRPVLREATLYAQQQSQSRGLTAGFSITTNGTLLKEDDADFFEAHGFAVTVSLDGPQAQHDALRPYRGGRGSYDAIMKRLAPLLRHQRKMQVSARVTVTPANLNLRETLDAFVSAGFHNVGFSPMLSSPNGKGEMQSDDLERMLEAMIECGLVFEQKTRAGERYPFANMLNAMKEIGKGTHRPYPCGAGAGYLGVSADGDLAACHRFVGDESGSMGSLTGGIDVDGRNTWLADRHVHRQAPCNTCWARYLCGGGCHHEVINRGRPACDFIRGWLHYCITAWLRLSSQEQTASRI